MKKAVVILLRKYGTLLCGRTLGTQHLGKVYGEVGEVPSGGVVILDFRGVKLISGSWINAMIVPFLHWASNDEANVFPIIRNMGSESLDDLAIVAGLANQCYLITNDGHLPPDYVDIIGRIETGQRDTLHFVQSHPDGITGARMAREADGKIGATAWNNRLRDLYTKRLIRCEKNGREHVYFPIVKEIRANG